MAHLYRLSVGTPGTIGDLERYLREQGLVSETSNIQINSVQATVTNKENFRRYVRRKVRESADPGWDIVNCEYLGEVGKAAPSSREGRQINQRIKYFRRAGRKR